MSDRAGEARATGSGAGRAAEPSSAPSFPSDDRRQLSMTVGRDGVSLLFAADAGGLVEERRLTGARREPERWRELCERLRRATAMPEVGQRRIDLLDLEGEIPRVVMRASRDTLADELGGGAVPWERALTLVTELAATLETAHRHGLVHGHLCPGQVAVIDQHPLLDVTGIDTGMRPGADWGHAHCLAPEEWATAASDVYALAALFELLLAPERREAPATPVSRADATWASNLTEKMLDPAPEKRPSMQVVRQLLERRGELLEVETAATIAGAGPTTMTLAEEEGAAATRAAGGEPSVGDRIGRYELLELLGQGGMGKVFRARDPVDDRVVAVKVLHSWVNDDRARRRFLREARLLARVDSPNVARLFDTGSDQGVHFMVMEFLAGESLGTILRREGAFEEERALAIAADIARGLADIHSAGIVHRDVKPSNVIIDEGGAARLCDFGIARTIEAGDATEITRAGSFVGTPQYMSPEQCLGREVDGRSDVYSVGTTLYATLSGRPPFDEGDVAAIIGGHLGNEPPPLTTLVKKLDPAVAELVHRCLEKTPELRYSDAGELLEEIERLRRGEHRRIELHPDLPRVDRKNIVTYTLELDLSATPEALWPLVTDTNRLNRAIGLGQVEVSRTTVDGEVETYGRSRALGIGLSWRELPFEWVAPHRFGVVRLFDSGPLLWYRSSVELAPTESGTRLRHTIDAAPRGWFGRVAAAFEIGVRTRRALARVYRRIDGNATAEEEANRVRDPFEASPELDGAALERLASIRERLVELGFDENHVAALVDYLMLAPPQEVARIRPREWAIRHGFEPQEVLALMLRAAHEGALVLRWDILCPTCRVASSMADALSQVRDHGHCEACNIDFELNFAGSIELVFQAHGQIRAADVGIYCIGAPAHRPHVVAQVALRAGERFVATTSLPIGLYRVASGSLDNEWMFRVVKGAPVPRLELALGTGIAADRPRSVAEGRQQLILQNDTEQELLVRVERADGAGEPVTAAEVACHPAFRELFAHELLSPGVLVSISRIAAVLVEISAMPDPEALAAYRAVAELRDEAESVAELEGGSAVKLAGDGVLLVFPDPVGAARAASTLVAGRLGAELRIAADLGPAMVTTVNRRHDYFGTVLSRLRELSGGAEPGVVALGASLVADPGVAQLLAGALEGAALAQNSDGAPEIRRHSVH